MSVEDLLRTLADRDVELYLDGDRLRFRAPAGALTPELRGEIADHRQTIIEQLRAETAPKLVPNRCSNCDQRNWVDEPTGGGRIRTYCGKCGHFVGYRPSDL